MEQTRTYWTPDYYADFACKCGTCRASCCEGWDVSLSMEEYFRLLGMDCSAELRRKLDSAFHMAEQPSPERYAQITHNWQGDCPLRREDGFCRLQCECGETALPTICRRYPRSPRISFANECACSNSCERVIEMLMERTAPIGFRQLDLTFRLPDAPVRPPERLIRHYQEIRTRSIGEIQNRAMPLRDRLSRLGSIMRLLDRAFQTGDDGEIARTMERCRAYDLPEAATPDLQSALGYLDSLNRVLGMESVSVGAWAQMADQFLSKGGDLAARYRSMSDTFEKNYPKWETFFENMLVNHMFYESFPFSDRRENLWDEFLSLCAVWSYARFLSVLCTADHPTEERLIDVCAAAFRLIDHSAFDWNALTLWRAANADERTLAGLCAC